jgi:protein TonB
VYPVIAQAARIEGDVTIEAIIGVDGAVTNLKVARSVALLDQAAIDAVRRWRYTPTLLNGVPIPVLMTVTVRFRLKD